MRFAALFASATLVSIVSGKSIEIDWNDAWIPNLRDITLREGDTVADFVVSSSSDDKDDNNFSDPADDEMIRADKTYNVCTDPESKIILYPSEDEEKPLPLTTAVEQFGRLDEPSTEGPSQSSVSFQSVAVIGKCCWEAFNRAFYNGKMLRMCRGKYSSKDLGSLASNIQSIRPVNFLFPSSGSSS